MSRRLELQLILHSHLLLHIHFMIAAPTVASSSPLCEGFTRTQTVLAVHQKHFTANAVPHAIRRCWRWRHAELYALHVIGKYQIAAMMTQTATAGHGSQHATSHGTRIDHVVIGG